FSAVAHGSSWPISTNANALAVRQLSGYCGAERRTLGADRAAFDRDRTRGSFHVRTCDLDLVVSVSSPIILPREFASSLYSITSSASASSVGGTSRPSSRAAC